MKEFSKKQSPKAKSVKKTVNREKAIVKKISSKLEDGKVNLAGLTVKQQHNIIFNPVIPNAHLIVIGKKHHNDQEKMLGI